MGPPYTKGDTEFRIVPATFEERDQAVVHKLYELADTLQGRRLKGFALPDEVIILLDQIRTLARPRHY